VLIGDASAGELDPDAPLLRAVELLCARAGARVLSLPVAALDGLAVATASASPSAVVVAGQSASDDDVAMWAQEVRARTGTLPLALYLRSRAPLRGCGRPTMLAESPGAARDQMLVGAGTPLKVAG
jgi:hypothetical protein